MAHFNDAWRSCDERFAQVRSYIEHSSAKLQPGPASGPSFRAELYGSWVLMTYGACQYAFAQIGTASMRFLAQRAKLPRDLERRAQIEHYRLTLNQIQRMVESGEDLADVNTALSGIAGRRWAQDSRLMRIERNVWPDFVREWLGRLGVERSALAWMEQPVSGQTETYASRMASLVQERNPIAHGEPVSQVLDATLMVDWLNDCRLFIEKSTCTIIEQLVSAYCIRMKPAGPVDRKIRLGSHTVAIEQVRSHVEAGDYLVLRKGSTIRAARVESIMSDGIQLDSVQPGAERVAITLSKPYKSDKVYLAP